MKRATALRVSVAALVAALPFAASAGDIRNQGLGQLATPMVAQDFGPASSDAEGSAMIEKLVAKWGNAMRNIYSWNDDAMTQFREGYKNYPQAVLQAALDAGTFQQMTNVLDTYAGLQSQRAMTKAMAARKTHALNALTPEEANDPQVAEAQKAITKALGDDARDLVFIPIAPCTVWDTRFATGAPYAGAIGNGVTREFWSHWNGAGTDFSPYGGNPSCAEANQTFIGGGRPYAVMMTVYVNNPVGNGWLTFYRDGDPDPSQATISVYYSPGPTRTQTVISKSNRGYGTGTYDIAVTGRFSTADASASVTGYFIKPLATALNCTNVESAAFTAAVSTDTFGAYPACPATYTRTGGYCHGPSFNNNGYAIETGAAGCVYRNLSSTTTYSFFSASTCCRVPGR